MREEAAVTRDGVRDLLVDAVKAARACRREAVLDERHRITSLLRASCYCSVHVDRCMYCQILPRIERGQT